jgi:hypothetical protein
MEATRHTWIMDPCEDAWGYFTVRMADGSPCGDTEDEPIATVYHEDNAELIAAAPDLLEALEKIAAKAATPWIVEIARAAIAKAVGR